MKKLYLWKYERFAPVEQTWDCASKLSHRNKDTILMEVYARIKPINKKLGVKIKRRYNI